MSRIFQLASFCLFTCSLLAGCSFNVIDQHEARNVSMRSQSRVCHSFYEDFFNKHEIQQASTVVAVDYKQHNPYVPDGKTPFVEYFEEYFKQNPLSRARIVRSATDGDLVYLHVHSTNGADDLGQAVIDIFRVVDGMIVEHWDVIQEVPVHAANNNTMF